MNDLIVRDGTNALTGLGFHDLSKTPPELVWLANLEKETTRRNYRGDVESFMRLFGLPLEKVRDATSAHVVAWRMHLKAEGNTGSTIRRRLSGLSSLFAYLRERDLIASNPVKDIERPKAPVQEGLTARLSDGQARRLLDAPSPATLIGKRDRAILAVFLFQGVRRAEACALRVRDLSDRDGFPHLRIEGKGDRIRFLPVHPVVVRRIEDYLLAAGHRDDFGGPLFRPHSRNLKGNTRRPISHTSIARDVVKKYARETGIAEETIGISTHSCRVTAIDHASKNGVALEHLQHWAGHASITTTRGYLRVQPAIEDSPTFGIDYGGQAAEEAAAEQEPADGC